MSRTVRKGLVGATAGVAVAALLVPTLAGGNARPKPSGETPLLAQLTGAAEAPGPGDPDGRGSAAVTIAFDPGGTGTLCYDVNVSGLSPVTAAHIHQGPPGVAGGIVLDLNAPTSGSSSGCSLLDTPAEIDLGEAILAAPGGFYVNVHTSDYPAGAVRGQLVASAGGANTFVLAEPLRAYDSRTDPAGKLAGGQTRTVSLQHGVGAGGVSRLAVPAGATAALVTLTITETENAGYVKLYSAALTTEPPTSNINWSESNQNLAVGTMVTVDPNGQVKLTGGVANTHVVLDVTGYLF